MADYPEAPPARRGNTVVSEDDNAIFTVQRNARSHEFTRLILGEFFSEEERAPFEHDGEPACIVIDTEEALALGQILIEIGSPRGEDL